MKLEVGKKYVCRNRSDIEYVVITRYIGPDALYPFRGEAKNTSGVYEPVSYDIDGSWVRPSHSANLDLIAEYVEPSLEFKLEVGKKYVTRHPSKIQYVEIVQYRPDHLPIFAMRGRVHYRNRDIGDCTWSINGQFLEYEASHALDLVAEYVEPLVSPEYNTNATIDSTKLKPRIQLADVVDKLHRMIRRKETLSKELQHDILCDLLDLARIVVNKPTKD